MAAFRAMNVNLLSRLNELAKERGIDWRIDHRQAGNLLWSWAFVRNGTGDEANVHAQINIDDEANVAYVCIVLNAAEKYEYLREKLEANPGIKQLAENEMPSRPNPKIIQYKLDDKFKFVNNGDIDKWLDEVLTHTTSVLSAVSNIVY